MNLLCFDISSGGISAALFSSTLELRRSAETQWVLETDDQGAATLSIEAVQAAFKHVIQKLNATGEEGPAVICMDCFMHNCVLLDAADRPHSPVFTWLDNRGEGGIEIVRKRIGDRF